MIKMKVIINCLEQVKLKKKEKLKWMQRLLIKINIFRIIVFRIISQADTLKSFILNNLIFKTFKIKIHNFSIKSQNMIIFNKINFLIKKRNLPNNKNNLKKSKRIQNKKKRKMILKKFKNKNLTLIIGILKYCMISDSIKILEKRECLQKIVVIKNNKNRIKFKI